MQKSLNKLSIKLFIGFFLNSELRMYLNQSSEWKEISIAPDKNQKNLTLIHFQGKEYLGCYYQEEKIKLNDLKKFENFIIHNLNSYCPDYELKNLKLCIFPQVFIA